LLSRQEKVRQHLKILGHHGSMDRIERPHRPNAELRLLNRNEMNRMRGLYDRRGTDLIPCTRMFGTNVDYH